MLVSFFGYGNIQTNSEKSFSREKIHAKYNIFICFIYFGKLIANPDMDFIKITYVSN